VIWPYVAGPNFERASSRETCSSSTPNLVLLLLLVVSSVVVAVGVVWGILESFVRVETGSSLGVSIISGGGDGVGS